MYPNNPRTASPAPYRSDSYDSIDVEKNLPSRPNPPARKLSSQWWDRKVVKGHLPRILYVVIGFTLMAIWVGVIFSFAQKETEAQESNASRDVDKLSRASVNVSNAVFLQGLLRQFDPNSRALTVQWSLVFPVDGSDDFIPANYSGNYGFYRDVRAVFDANLTDTVNDGFNYFSLDNYTAPRLGVLGMHPWDSVDTDIDMGPTESGDIWKAPLFGYPWDEWTGSITTAMNNMDSALDWGSFITGTSFDVGLFAFSPDGVTLVGNVLNWKIQAVTAVTSSCTDPNVPLEESTCELEINFVAKRPGIVIFCVLVVVVVNWISTIAIFLVTGEAILLRRRHILEGTDMLAVCLSALFALPTVRALLPGAPAEFGAVIDLVGILPNVIIISLCTSVFAAARINMRIQQSLATSSEKSN